MSDEPTLLRVGFRVEKPLMGHPLVVLTAVKQCKSYGPSFDRIYETDATPSDLARAVERGWIRTGEKA